MILEHYNNGDITNYPVTMTYATSPVGVWNLGKFWSSDPFTINCISRNKLKLLC
jgi:hypothetical protein